jgi:hypothetical protein
MDATKNRGGKTMKAIESALFIFGSVLLFSISEASPAEPYAGYGEEPTQSGHVGEKEYSPYLDIGYPQRVFWGDTHVHTAYSTDAGMVGNRLGPDEAYRFARGEAVVSSTGVRARLQRPLDFLVVADHAENLGLAPMIDEKNPDLLKTDFGRQISQLVYAGKYGDAYALWGSGMSDGEDPLKGNDALTRTMWERLTASAEEFNELGKFTALIGACAGSRCRKSRKGRATVRPTRRCHRTTSSRTMARGTKAVSDPSQRRKTCCRANMPARP